MTGKTHSVDDVFGIVRDVPLNYVARNSVDEKLIDGLSRTKHLVIHGGSKQGKTCLRKHCLSDDDYIVVQCSNKWSVEDLNENILKRAGFEVTQSNEKTLSGRNKLSARVSGGFMGFGASADASDESQNSVKQSSSPLQIDPGDVNDLIGALKSIEFNKFIVLEDFHYLTPEAQSDIAIELKAIHEASSFCVVVVGVWLEENRLIVYNGDLTGRIIPINADRWTEEELLQVIEEGENLLKVRISNDFKMSLVTGCFDSVAIVQECCRRACRESGVFETQPNLTDVLYTGEVTKLIKDVVNESSARYQAFLTNFADGFQDTRLEMYRWLLFPILSSNVRDLENGILYAEIRRELQTHHPDGGGLNPGNITQALKSATSLQVYKGIKPIVLDYDATTRRLSVVDRGFLIWLANQDTVDVLEMAGLPTDMGHPKLTDG
jgi:hypothetical protein